MKKTVMAFGSFDVLHPGHLNYLRKAAKYGNLVVVVARDKSIEKLKGRKPLIDENSRLEIIRSLRFVHKGILGDRIRKWNDIYKVLLKFRPDVIAFGYDQKVDMDYLAAFLKQNNMTPKIIKIKPYRSSKFKSSKLKELMTKY